EQFQKTIEQSETQTILQVNGVALNVEQADTREKQTQGLSGRKVLKEDAGMLFVYENVGNPRIWMKDMHFPIDIIWINREKEVVEIHENISPDTYPQVFYSSVPVQYVLEVNAGWSKKVNITIGDTISGL
ncbi:MAG: DUF192 domain-containing protein, partial [archaeon]|nr:DUF192 domain-containing protein [archaeon]